MKKNVKHYKTEKYTEDARRYNECYDAAQSAIIELNKVSKECGEAEKILSVMRVEVENASKAYSDASAVFHATGRVIEDLKKKKQDATLTGSEKKMLETKLASAYQFFYEAYNEEQARKVELLSCKNRAEALLEQKEKAEFRLEVARKNVRKQFERFYDIAKMIERKYGLYTSKNKLLRMPLESDEDINLDGIEKL